jgi:hypothetical protein
MISKFLYFFGMFLISLIFLSPAIAQEQPKDNPIPVISNINSTSFTVSWFSRDTVDQAILYGTAEPLTAWAVDDRGLGVERVTHHVTLRNLQPNTEYLFRINTDGKLFKQKTANTITGILPPLPERFKGKVLTEDQTVPAESNIYMKVAGSQLLSTTGNVTTGDWEIRTANTRAENLESYFKIRELDYVDFYVRAGYEGDNAKKIYAYARENAIDLTLSAPRIPFYKVKLPGQVQFEAEVVEAGQPTPSVEPTVQSENEEGLLSVIWKRISEIF